ncbi:MAG: hypothetical protein AB1925_12520 [Actinomycetota bacterium]
MDVDIPEKNAWRGQWLKSNECRALVFERGHTAQMMYQAEVSRRSGRLAGATRVSTALGGPRRNYWEATLTVGGLSASGLLDYVLPHEFGARERYDANRGDPLFDETHGAHDLDMVLELLALVPL